EEMRVRIRARHGAELRRQQSKTEPVAHVIRQDGWRKMLFDTQRRETVLLVLPEKINDGFVDRLKTSLQSNNGVLTVLSTCHMETYPEGFLQFLSEQRAEMFSLPDFLEDQDLWLEFIGYLGESRKVTSVWYGQNCFFLEKLPAVSQVLPRVPFNYIARYSTGRPQISRAVPCLSSGLESG